MSRTSRRTLTAATFALFLAVATPTAAFADADSLSPATAVAVTPTLTVAPTFSVGRLCLPGSTCP